MPNRCLTILNANQSTSLFIPLPGGPDEPYNTRDHILTQGRKKFQVKVLNIVYRWGGEVVYDGDTLQKQIEEVLVSRDEAYTGPPAKYTRTGGNAGEVSVLANQGFLRKIVSLLAPPRMKRAVEPQYLKPYQDIKPTRSCDGT